MPSKRTFTPVRVVLLVLAVAIGLAIAGVAVLLVPRLGPVMRLEDQSTQPFLSADDLEVVAELNHLPGNIAVSKSGRVFFTLHPEGSPPAQLVMLHGNRPVPYPDSYTQDEFASLLGVRIDRQERLWVLDYGRYGINRARLIAFDTEIGERLHEYDFPFEVAGFLSMLNDFQVSPDGSKIYIAEASPFLETPAIVVYDTVRRTSRRLLERHASVLPENYVIQAPGRDMMLLGLIPLRIGVDSIALDVRGEWLYYGPVNGDRLFRIKTSDLNDESLSAEELARRVEDHAPKPISDGLSMDIIGNVYITAPEQSAIFRLRHDGVLETLVEDPRLRWPDGLSFGPEGWLYITCSALHEVMFKLGNPIEEHRPYHIYRIRSGSIGIAGH